VSSSTPPTCSYSTGVMRAIRQLLWKHPDGPDKQQLQGVASFIALVYGPVHPGACILSTVLESDRSNAPASSSGQPTMRPPFLGSCLSMNDRLEAAAEFASPMDEPHLIAMYAAKQIALERFQSILLSTDPMGVNASNSLAIDAIESEYAGVAAARTQAEAESSIATLMASTARSTEASSLAVVAGLQRRTRRLGSEHVFLHGLEHPHSQFASSSLPSSSALPAHGRWQARSRNDPLSLVDEMQVSFVPPEARAFKSIPVIPIGPVVMDIVATFSSAQRRRFPPVQLLAVSLLHLSACTETALAF